MFFSQELLTKKGVFATIWLAATLKGKRPQFSRKNILSVNIVKAIGQLLDSVVPMSLRLKSQLLFGLVVVYEKKVHFLLADVNELWLRVSRQELGENLSAINLPRGHSEARVSEITLRDGTSDFFLEDVAMSCQSVTPPLTNDNFFQLKELNQSDNNLLVSIEAARSALSSRRVTIATNGESEALDAHFDNIREANTAKECFDIAPEAPLHEVLQENVLIADDKMLLPELPLVTSPTSVTTFTTFALPADEFVVTDLAPLNRDGFHAVKKKRVIIDTRIQLTSKQIRNNVNDTSDTVTLRPVVGNPLERKQKALSALICPNMDMCDVLENLWCEMANMSLALAPSGVELASKADTLPTRPRGEIECLSTVFETTLAVEDIEAFAPFMQSTVESKTHSHETKTTEFEEIPLYELNVDQQNIEEMELNHDKVSEEIRNVVNTKEESDEESLGYDIVTAHSVISDQYTQRFLRYLRRATEKRISGLTFQSLLHGSDRNTIAKAFFQLLVVSSIGAVQPRQDEPYAAINVTVLHGPTPTQQTEFGR